MALKTVLVTLAIGDNYQRPWNHFCRPNWQRYADRYGYDIVCFETPLDPSLRAQQRSPAWQKCLILSQEAIQTYDRVVWLDADVVINPTLAPAITEGIPLEQVGGVDAYATPTAELCRLATERFYEFLATQGMAYIPNLTPQSFYGNYGLPGDLDRVVQTGVLVLSPRYHRELLEYTYFHYEEKGGSEWNYEMRPLSYELVKQQWVHWLDYRFNVTWTEHQALYYPFLWDLEAQPDVLGTVFYGEMERMCVNTAFMNHYFLHFSGFGFTKMALLEPVLVAGG